MADAAVAGGADRAGDKESQRREKCPNQIGKYLVGGIIGKGGFGSVYRALDQEKALLVAIKQMSSSVLGSGDLGSIEMEINLLSKLKHRNIVKYIDSIRTEQHLNIVLEYIEGGSLAGIVKKFHAIPEGLCAIYTLQILLGLQYLHSQGVVHRDIKGANVLVTKKGTVKLADFGVATKLSEVDNSKRCVVGTPYWMAPEIVEMSSPTPACDIWSVGGTVVEMITESPPYFHLPQVSALYRIVSDPHPPLPECISAQLESFLLACWEKNPSLRAGAGELLQHEWIQIHKQHTIGLSRSRRNQRHGSSGAIGSGPGAGNADGGAAGLISPSGGGDGGGDSVVGDDGEGEDDDEDFDEDAEAVESFMATVAEGKDLSSAFLAASSSPSGAAGSVGGVAAVSRGTSAAVSAAGLGAASSSASAVASAGGLSLQDADHSSSVDVGSALHKRKAGRKRSMPLSPPRAATAAIEAVEQAEGGLLSPSGSPSKATAGQGGGQAHLAFAATTAAAGAAGSGVPGAEGAGEATQTGVAQLVPDGTSDSIAAADDKAVVLAMPHDASSSNAATGSVPQEPISAAALAAGGEGQASAPSSNNEGEYHFFFLEYFQKMDQQRTLAASAAAAAAAAASAAATASTVAAGGGASAGGTPSSEASTQLQQRGTPATQLVQPLQLVVHSGSNAGAGTPLPPPPQESALVGGPAFPHLGGVAGAGGVTPRRAAAAAAAGLGGAGGPLAPPLQTQPPAASAAGQRDATEIKQLLSQIKPFEEPETLAEICKRLTALMQQKESNCLLVVQYGAVPIVEMLQVPDPALLRVVLKMVNQLMDGSQVAQEVFATFGLIPGVIKFAKSQDLPPLRREAAHFISRLCNTSPRSLQMLVACGGLEALADLVAHDYYNNRDLVWLALDALVRIFEHADQNGRVNDFCRILAKHGLCGHLCVLIDTLAGDIRERAAQYLKVVIDLILAFAKEGDAIVKVYMAKQPVLEGFISALEFLPQDLSVLIFKTFKWLAQEPSVLNMLENAGVVPVLVTQLAALSEEEAHLVEKRELSKDPCSQCLLALFYLCKLARPRQEQSALAGVVPVLQGLVERNHGLKVYAFVMLSDLTSASLATRRILWHSGGVGLLVRSLNDPELQAFALEALVGWIGVKEHRADWCERLEGVLFRDGGEFVPQLLALFRFPDASVFMKVLEQLVKLARLSERLVAALAKSDEFFEVSALRLQPRGLQQHPQPSRSCSIGHWRRTVADVAPSPVSPSLGAAGALESAAAELASPGQGAPGEVGEAGAGSGGTVSVAASPGPPPTAASAGVAGSGTATGLAIPPSGAPAGASAGAASGGRQGALVRQESMAAGPPQDGYIPDDDVVRARKNLLMLLLRICQSQESMLADLCVRHELPALIKAVLLEEKRRHRVILCDFASQLLELFRRALSSPAESPPPALAAASG